MSKLNQLENNLETLGLMKFKEQLQYSLSKQILDNQVYIGNRTWGTPEYKRL